jgi:hypothetical protein
MSQENKKDFENDKMSKNVSKWGKKSDALIFENDKMNSKSFSY